MNSSGQNTSNIPGYDPANLDQFYFVCNGIKNDELVVKEFIGNEKISHITEFEIILTSKNRKIKADALLGQHSALLIYKKGFCYSFSGIISSFSFVSSNTDYFEYRAILSNSLWLLTLPFQSRVFQKKSIPDIIKDVLNENNLANLYEFALTANYQVKEYVVQYEESDYNFICRLMESCGLFYFIKEEPFEIKDEKTDSPKQKIIITDNNSVFPFLPIDKKIDYKKRSGLIQSLDLSTQDHIFELETKDKVVTKKVVVKNYNYRTPEVNLQSDAPVKGGHEGLQYEYGGDFKSIDEAKKNAEMIAKRIVSKKQIISGESFCRGLRTGHKTEIYFYGDNTLSTEVLLTEIKHKCTSVNNTSKGNKLLYTNEFKALPSDILPDYLPEESAEKVRIPGVLPGLIEGMGSEYAAVDDVGRYKVRMPYDLSETDNYDGSKYIRMAQAYSGADYGMHFPSHENSEVILGHINENPDKPVGLGTVPNANTISPVTNNNKENSSIKTAGNNALTMNDTEGKQQMSASTPYDMSISAGNNQNISVANDRSVSVGNNEKKEISGNQKETISGNVEESTGGDKSVKIGGNVTVSVSGTEEHTYQASRNVTISGNEKLTLQSTASTEVTAVNSEKYGANNTIEASSNVIDISKGPLTIKSSGNIDVKAGSLSSFESMAINVVGTSKVVLMVGGSTIEASAAGVKIESSGKVVISGSLVNATGGVLLINGTPVNIN
jgi:type VI secretion system secreted protein VgrG